MYRVQCVYGTPKYFLMESFLHNLKKKLFLSEREGNKSYGAFKITKRASSKRFEKVEVENKIHVVVFDRMTFLS